LEWTVVQLLQIALVGLVGGTLGGLLGLGGSIFIIPTLTLLYGPSYHLYQASALVANVFVATAATRRHRGRGTIRRDLVFVMPAATAIASFIGVMASNAIPSASLYVVFGAFLCYAAAAELLSLARRVKDHAEPPVGETRWILGSVVGAIGGFASGLLGIGGGAIMVPLLRKFGKLPLRQAVATSAAAMIAACLIGAIAKNATLEGLSDPTGKNPTLASSMTLAAILSPAAMLGGSLGAALVYRLPIAAIRLILALLLVFAGVRMILAGLS
jgi:uncharacterized membrane protein YfcA